MRILVDLNVILDVLFDREPHASSASALWAAVESGAVDGLLAAHNVTTLHYLATRARGREFGARCVADVLSVFDVAPVDRAVVEDALALGWGDFEDAVCAVAAAACDCRLIATRDLTGFRGAPIPALDPRGALEAARIAGATGLG
jgi:predicted nucleic acid-binding protein